MAINIFRTWGLDKIRFCKIPSKHYRTSYARGKLYNVKRPRKLVQKIGMNCNPSLTKLLSAENGPSISRFMPTNIITLNKGSTISQDGKLAQRSCMPINNVYSHARQTEDTTFWNIEWSTLRFMVIDISCLESEFQRQNSLAAASVRDWDMSIVNWHRTSDDNYLLLDNIVYANIAKNVYIVSYMISNTLFTAWKVNRMYIYVYMYIINFVFLINS